MRNRIEWETRRHDDRIAEDADQAELVAVKYGSCNFEAGTFDDRIADALDDYDVTDPDPRGVPRWASEDLKLESATSDVGLEVNRRADVLGAYYPFTMDGNRLIYRRSRMLVYEFCLATSQSRSLSEGEFGRLPIAFERLVRDVLICFLGPGAEGFRTGWPPDKHEARPTHFKEVVSKLNELTGEWRWQPDAGLPSDPIPQHVKDEGLDVVVWKAVPDKRGGKLFLLCQCACGDDYPLKFHDIDSGLTKLGKWVKPISWAWPLRVFSTPRHIPNNADFEQVNRQAGLTLDRVRLTMLAEHANHSAFIKARTVDALADLVALVIAGFQVG